jgi:hypothetical protein
LFQLYFHIAQGHISCRIAHILGVACFLTMTKFLNGVHPIVVREILYQLINHDLCFQFHNAFATHISLHQFRIATKGGYETIVHGIRCTFDLDLDWVVLNLNVANVFNLVLKGVIFHKLHATCGDIIQFIPFVHAFYAFEYPLFYNHHNCDGNVTIIPSTMGIHQGDPLGGALFTLVHFKALRSIVSNFSSYLFPSIVHDTHIIGPPSIVSFAYEHFQTELCVIGFFVQLQKCVTRSFLGLPPNFKTPS